MKKITNYLIASALMAFTFTSCEDVPSPYGTPVNPNQEVTVDPTGTGTADDPFNVAAVIEFTSALAADVQSDVVYTKGYVCQIDDIDTNGTYGNSTYWICDDAEGKTKKFEVFRGYGLGGQKFNETGAKIIKEGDAVVVKGKVKNYKGTTVEYDSGSTIVELNGEKATEGGGGNEGGGGGGESGTAVTLEKSIDGTVVTLTNSQLTAGATPVSASMSTYGWENAAVTTKVTLDNGTTIEFGKGEGSNDPKYYTSGTSVRMYAKNTLTITSTTDDIAKIVITCPYADKTGNETLVATSKDKVVTVVNEHSAATGGVQLQVQKIDIYYVGEGGSEGGEGGGGSAYDYDFTKGVGDWTIVNAKALAEGVSAIWNQDATYGMKATAYISGTRYETDSWLISPALTLANGATMKFAQAQRYAASGCTDLHVMVSSAYTSGNIDASQWTEVTPSEWPAGTNWNFIDCTATIPAGTTRVAFRYTSTTTTAATWEIKTVKFE